MKNCRKKVVTVAVVFAIAAISMEGCSISADKTIITDNVQKSTQEPEGDDTLKSDETALDNKTVKQEDTDLRKAAEERKRAAFNQKVEERIAEYKKILEEKKNTREELLVITRADVQNGLLETMQNYYMSLDSYTTEDGTVGDLITSAVADAISAEVAGGSSSVSAAIVSAANSIRQGDSPGELVTDAFSAAMENLPSEVTEKVFEYMFGGTIMKGLEILDTLATNQQSQHLVNLIDHDLKQEIQELNTICANQDVTLQEAYRAIDLCQSICDKTIEIELTLNVNAGSSAWKPIYQGGEDFLAGDLEMLAHCLELEIVYERYEEVLDSLEEIPYATMEEFENFTSYAEGRGDLEIIDNVEDQTRSVYDLDDAARRSQDTKIWNAIGTVIDNPITDGLLMKYNQKEYVSADILASFNTQARELWRNIYFPIKEKMRRFYCLNEIGDIRSLVFAGENDDISGSIGLEMCKIIWGENPTTEAFCENYKNELKELAPGLYQMMQASKILSTAYYIALTDSERNQWVVNNYQYISNISNSAWAQCLPYIDRSDSDVAWEISTASNNENVVALAELSSNMIQKYIECLDERSDLQLIENIMIPTNDSKIYIGKALIKAPLNGEKSAFLSYLQLKLNDNYQPIDIYYIKSGMPYWINEPNTSFKGYVGDFGTNYLPEMFRDQVKDPMTIDDAILKQWYLDGAVSDYFNKAEVFEGTVSYSSPVSDGLLQYLQLDMQAYRQMLSEEAEEDRIWEERDRQLTEKYQEIEKMVQADKNCWWMNEDAVIERFTSKVLKTYIYEQFKKEKSEGKWSDIAEQPEGFGNLSVKIPYSKENHSITYVTENGLNITIRLSHPTNSGELEEYTFWFPGYSFENYICNQTPLEYIELMEN